MWNLPVLGTSIEIKLAMIYPYHGILQRYNQNYLGDRNSNTHVMMEIDFEYTVYKYKKIIFYLVYYLSLSCFSQYLLPP